MAIPLIAAWRLDPFAFFGLLVLFAPVMLFYPPTQKATHVSGG